MPCNFWIILFADTNCFQRYDSFFFQPIKIIKNLKLSGSLSSFLSAFYKVYNSQNSYYEMLSLATNQNINVVVKIFEALSGFPLFYSKLFSNKINLLWIVAVIMNLYGNKTYLSLMKFFMSIWICLFKQIDGK